MTLAKTPGSDVERLWAIGLASGVVFAVLFPSWPMVGAVLGGWFIWMNVKKRAARFSATDVLWVAGGWLVAVMVSNLWLNWSSFQSGCIAGWQAAP